MPKGAARTAGRYYIAAVGKALDVLEALRDAERLSLAELSERVGQPRSSLFRILDTLECRGYVEHLPDVDGYALGLAAASLAGRHTVSAALRRVARPVLTELAEELGETVNLGMLLGAEVVYVDMVESHYAMRMNVTIGSRSPAHSTSLGKALLAFAGPEVDLQRLLPPALPAMTPNTITDREQLLKELKVVRARGWSLDDEENEPGARCVGAPILGNQGSAVAAISVAGPASRLSDDRVPQVARLITAAAGKIAAELAVYKIA
ncbi:MAG: IclR family transcriptional regulator [Limnochordales bacterium]|nr:IclR family transcriptional regulator [Limnochordales bacterium]